MVDVWLHLAPSHPNVARCAAALSALSPRLTLTCCRPGDGPACGQADRQGYDWAYIRTDLEHQNSALAVYTLLEDLLASIVEWACTPPSATAETRALTAPYGDGGYKAVDSDR
jgi:hypothetical protein